MAPDVKAVLTRCALAEHDSTAALDELRSLSLAPEKVDAVARDLLFDLCDTEQKVSSTLSRFLETILDCSEAGLCGPDLPLSLLEEAMDTQTIAGCNNLFAFLETHRHRMTRRMGRGLVLLRLCNELLRRLSKTEDTVFCGRILIFLSLVFPLSERSAVNLRGEYNLENVTSVEEQAEGEDGTAEAELDVKDLDKGVPFSFYSTFWSLQQYFNNPTLLTTAPLKLSQFHTAATTVVTALRSIEQSSEKHEESSARKRRAGDGGLDQNIMSYFTPKVLTSRKLLGLELADTTFRHHILVQMVILLEHLLSHTASNLEKWIGAAPVVNRSLSTSYVLPMDDAQWITDLRDQVTKTLEMSQGGRSFVAKVEDLLKRDRAWLRWKCSGCPSYDKPSIDKARLEAAPLKLTTMIAPKRPYPHTVGNAVLSKLWSTAGGWSAEEVEECPSLPKTESYLEAVSKLDNQIAETNSEEEINNLEDRKASNVWRALRIARMSDVEGFTDKVAGGNLAAYLVGVNANGHDSLATEGQDDVPTETADSNTESLAVTSGGKRAAPENLPEGVEEKRQKMST